VDFAAKVHQERAVGDVQHVNDAKSFQVLYDGFAVLYIPRLQSDIADLVGPGHGFDIDSAEAATKVADHGGDSAKATRSIADPQT
jgi:hypothetical protein